MSGGQKIPLFCRKSTIEYKLDRLCMVIVRIPPWTFFFFFYWRCTTVLPTTYIYIANHTLQHIHAIKKK
jgi:hypothetical protein